MEHPIRSLHHVTATVDDAQQDLDFCVDALGLRLVKKTVNFDNHNVYHFYYGDETRHSGHHLDDVSVQGLGTCRSEQGLGQVGVTSFSVPEGSLPFWRSRLAARGITAAEAPARFGEPSLVFTDPSGLTLELVAAADARAPWTDGGVPEAHAIRGLHSVTLTVDSPKPTVALLERAARLRHRG